MGDKILDFLSRIGPTNFSIFFRHQSSRVQENESKEANKKMLGGIPPERPLIASRYTSRNM